MKNLNRSSRIGCDRFNPLRKRLSLHQIAAYYKATKLDPSFQRKGGVFYGSGWSIDDSNDYINSFIEGSVENKILLAHVENCLEWSKKVGCKESEGYFRGLQDEGFQYVSIDGNNSSSTIFAFVKGVNLGSVDDPVYIRSSLLEEEFPKTGGLFMNLPVDQQQELLSEDKLDVTIYNKILLHEMTDKFRKVNKQTSLNPQEYRQARSTALAAQIRSWASLHEATFKNGVFSNSSDLDARRVDEEIAKFVCKVKSNYTSNLNHSGLDALYEVNQSLDRETTRTVSSVLSAFGPMVPEPLQKMLKKSTIANLLELIKIVQDSGYKVQNANELLKWFLRIDNELTMQSKGVTEENQKEESYTFWSNRYSQPVFYNRVSDVLKISFTKSERDLEKEGVISRVRDSKDIYSHNQKLELMSKQRYTDRYGVPYSVLDLYTGKLHADHVKSVKDGGETTIENGEMMTAKDNLSKGANSAEPYFDFQRPEQVSLNL